MVKLAARLITLLALSGLVVAQSQAQAPTSSSQQPVATQPAGRPPVKTKSQAEYQAYQAAIANAQNPDAMAKAADEFAAKFPDSEVRVLLYRAAMGSYQANGNSAKMMDTGLKVLSIDKDDPEALIGVAEVLEEHTSPTDLDREQRGNQAIENAAHALKTIDTDLAVPAGTPPEKLEGYKKYLRSTALAILGTIYYKQENYSEAEAKLRDSIDADSSNPDPVVILRLALALDQQKKYQDALKQANRAVELTQENTDVGKMARNERDRLVVQTGGDNAPGAPPATTPQTPSPQNPPPQKASPPNPVPPGR